MRKQPDETAEIERVLIACALQHVEMAGRLTARVEPVMFAAANRGTLLVGSGPCGSERPRPTRDELTRWRPNSAARVTRPRWPPCTT